ncbi:exodeoxyribonuclease VII large subunit [Shewanella marina]|uniref:exodeoxyribonuclease VII large subunit n=1 Tax=Shewanella marina TaxID=487319 RepID=UPI00047298A4|nr:exodeoxyribonuclease VII large subunit [Shewanella marina]
MKQPENNVYTVSRLNGEVRQLLEGQIGKVWLNGEISNFAAPSSGHWYLTLKDTLSQIRCAMFKGRNKTVTFTPKNGQQVIVKAAISVYEPRGDYQLIIESMLPAGDGLLAQQYEALKLKLAAEGLFAANTKRPLPSKINKIGVITSASGAAIRDVLQVLKRRDPSLEIIIYPTQVQGELAAKQICQAINLANSRLEVDVLLLTRGGGSLEDLWCFNDEGLAHTIYNSALPIVSAVGHEVDITISDYVADLRAPTPSAGAELLSKDSQDKQQRLITVQQRLQQSWSHYQLNQQSKLQQFAYGLQKQDPKRRLQQFEQLFDEMQLRLDSALANKLYQAKLRQQQLQSRLERQSPTQVINLEARNVQHLSSRLKQVMKDIMARKQQQFNSQAHQLDTVSPLATLSRGYSISRDQQGHILTQAGQCQSGDIMTTQLAQGEIKSKVL